jgi:DNA invertase Pin-like site-specific DNA recombinase
LLGQRDHLFTETALLERELTIHRSHRCRRPPKQRPHYTPEERAQILSLMALRHWSPKKTAERFGLHPNTVRSWLDALDYIRSQKHEGWAPVETRYDDGGFSGGTMKRPALERLLEDIDRGRIDAVVVYKVDRLSRSLTDFARMMQLFDDRGVSFVSVTQQFNTSTSMGRLTMNMLLSFAQFEREVAGERIRDKIAATKKRGWWVCGQARGVRSDQDRLEDFRTEPGQREEPVDARLVEFEPAREGGDDLAGLGQLVVPAVGEADGIDEVLRWLWL